MNEGMHMVAIMPTQHGDPDFEAARQHLQEQSKHGVIEGMQPIDLEAAVDFINRLEEEYDSDNNGIFTVPSLYDDDGENFPQKTSRMHGILVNTGAMDVMVPEDDEPETTQGDLFDD